MTIVTPAPADFEASQPTRCPTRVVVAVVLECRGRIALFRRSQSVQHDRGLWHCITGYLEPGSSPRQQALEELREETGLTAVDLTELRPGEQLLLTDHTGDPWLVHTFRAVSTRRRLTINDEHDGFRWAVPEKVSRFCNRVAWLDGVLEAARAKPDQGDKIMTIVEGKGRSPKWLKETL